MYKGSKEFREDFPNGYQRNGTVYDGQSRKIGYVTGDGGYRITERGSNYNQYYDNRRK